MVQRAPLVSLLKTCISRGLSKEIDALCDAPVQVGDVRQLLDIYHIEDGCQKIGPGAVERYETFIGKIISSGLSKIETNNTHWRDALASVDEDPNVQ